MEIGELTTQNRYKPIYEENSMHNEISPPGLTRNQNVCAGVLADLVHRGFGPPQTIPFLIGLLELFQFIKQFRYSSGHFHNFSKHL